MRVRHAVVTGLTGLLVAAWCPPAIGDDPAAPYGADHLVVAGALEPGWPTEGTAARFEYLAYYPTRLQIHRGDVVFFRIDGFHTVTFSPVGEERQGLFRRDEVEPMVAAGHTEPSDRTCGTSVEAPPCVLDRTDKFVNSGWKLMPAGSTDIDHDLKLKVDLPVGTYTYYCTIHTGMEGQIEVVPDDQAIATPEEVEEQRQAQVTADTEAAVATLEQPWPLEFEQVDGTDRRRYRIQAGAFTPDKRVSLEQYFPATAEIAPGDEVEFFVPEGGFQSPEHIEPVYNAHTVSFPNDFVRQNVLGGARYMPPACDPDGATSGLPGFVHFPAIFMGCPDGMEREMWFAPIAFQHPLRAPGDAVLTPATQHDSGMLVTPDGPCRSSCDPWTRERLPTTTTSLFPAEGTFSYSCLLHGPVMGGTIHVVEP